MRGKPVLSVVLTDDDFLADNSTLKTVLGGLLLTYFEKMFHSSFPAYALFFLLFFKVEISSHTPIPPSMPESVHSGSTHGGL